MPILYQQRSLSPGIPFKLRILLFMLPRPLFSSSFTDGSAPSDSMGDSVLPQIVLSVLKSRRGESKCFPEVSKSQLKRQRCSRKNSDELTPVNSVVRIITLIRIL